jgi:hypothetical protein
MRSGRPLTPGERALVSSVFGTAIDCDPVRIHRAKWWMWQPAWVTMAPDGHLWFHPNDRGWHDDFSTSATWSQRHFIHEMTHVWQHQQGIDLRLKRPPFARYRYLPLTPAKPFHRYGLEQQAEITADAFCLARGLHLGNRPPLDTYTALIPFWPGVNRDQGALAVGSPRGD